jgi:transcriptional regulator with XRE-family HTH domain
VRRQSGANAGTPGVVRKEVPTRRLLRAIGRRIAEARAAAGLTQEDAAHASGIPYKRWQRLEQGGVNPTVRTLAVVAQALDLDFWTLVRPGAQEPEVNETAARRPRRPARAK